MCFSGAVLTLGVIGCDTWYYLESGDFLVKLSQKPVITPFNNLIYNTNADNLALHGSHPFYQHFLVNLSQLLGPAILVLPFIRRSIAAFSAVSATALLSLAPHQEARFLLPCVPLLLSTVHVPLKHRLSWLGAWAIFNLLFGVLMGLYHQAGIIPAQLFLGTQPSITRAFWWKTYSPPTWLLGSRQSQLVTTDLMGMSQSLIVDTICRDSSSALQDQVVLVAPASALFLDQFISSKPISSETRMELTELWSFRKHLNLDDVDVGDEGLVPTIQRVVGRRGLKIWSVACRT